MWATTNTGNTGRILEYLPLSPASVNRDKNSYESEKPFHGPTPININSPVGTAPPPPEATTSTYASD